MSFRDEVLASLDMVAQDNGFIDIEALGIALLREVRFTNVSVGTGRNVIGLIDDDGKTCSVVSEYVSGRWVYDVQ